MKTLRTRVSRHTPIVAAVLASMLVMSHAPTASAAVLSLSHSFVNTTTDVGTGVTNVLSVPSSHTYGHTFNSPTTVIPG